MKVDVVYKMEGACLPKYHEYQVYSAMAKILESRFGLDLHREESIQIHPVRGEIFNDKVWLREKSRLSIRCDIGFSDAIASLGGTSLFIGDFPPVTLRNVRIFPLKPAPTLYCHRIIFSSITNFQDVIESAVNRLKRMGVTSAFRVRIPSKKGVPQTRLFRISKQNRSANLIGFPLIIEGLSDKDSIAVQEKGLGGWKRKMGCGIFVPWLGEIRG